MVSLKNIQQSPVYIQLWLIWLELKWMGQPLIWWFNRQRAGWLSLLILVCLVPFMTDIGRCLNVARLGKGVPDSLLFFFIFAFFFNLLVVSCLMIANIRATKLFHYLNFLFLGAIILTFLNFYYFGYSTIPVSRYGRAMSDLHLIGPIFFFLVLLIINCADIRKLIIEESQLASIRDQLLNEWEAVDENLKEFLNKINEYKRHLDCFVFWAELGIFKRPELAQEIKLYFMDSTTISTVLKLGETTLKKYEEMLGPYLKAFPDQEPGITEFIKSLEKNIENFKEMRKFFLGHAQLFGEP